MNKRIKALTLAAVAAMVVNFYGCGEEKTVQPQENSGTGAQSSEAASISSKEDYANYLEDRANVYLTDLKIDTDYDFNKLDEAKVEVSEDMVTGTKTSYEDLRQGLENLKTDLETNVKSDDAEVKKMNADVIASIDKNLAEINKAHESLDKDSDSLLKKSKDDFISTMKDIEKAPRAAKDELIKMINDAKNTLGIK
ncbi:MAG: hypothetical protein SPJ62_16250 [Inconstantimicrobium porci]|uniref:hypothetical protein n=1 Tax=Inconstantimicrobium porci TaxID=2652291 RepID=UPI0024096F17|nr:hypothetical protein [Inconstantimicrobium porci]MDD6772046.1 hypothetical protein [Inconstantimicrobium porci]MDY5913517.1 hypothetical protein [Inconstantimicrobium porci]